MAEKTFDIIKHYDKVSADLVAKYSKFEESASICECMNMRNAFGGKVKPVWPGTRCCGPAFTVDARPGDNLILHKAIDMIKPGDVLVVCYHGSTATGGMWGGMMTACLKAKGVAGMVTDGAVRDTMTMKQLDFPVFSQAVNVRGTTKAMPGKINHPVVMCGTVVNPGDLVFADNDDVVIVPKEIAAEVYEKVKAREDKEDRMLKVILAKQGTTYDLNGNDKKLQVLIDNGQVTEEPDD